MSLISYPCRTPRIYCEGEVIIASRERGVQHRAFVDYGFTLGHDFTGEMVNRNTGITSALKALDV